MGIAHRRRNATAFERFSRASELPMLVLALLLVPVLLLPAIGDLSPAADAAFNGAAWIIWAAFAGEYLVKLYLAPDRWHMVRTHVFDLMVIALPFLRPLRPLRILRVLGAGSALGRAGVAVHRLLNRRGFRGFLLLVAGVIAVSGTVVWLFERRQPDAEIATVVDGLWWALVTSTTVGYGDMVPMTSAGRGIAVLLMLVGIALLSVVTANIAAFFVEEGNDDLVDVRERLDRIELALQELRDAAISSQREGHFDAPEG